MPGKMLQKLADFLGLRKNAKEAEIEYNGYRIRPTPFSRLGQYQTAGLIEKEIGGEAKQYPFVRAETHSSHEEAIAFSIAKARQIIDEQGDRIFD
jgi:hypothetical protein